MCLSIYCRPSSTSRSIYGRTRERQSESAPTRISFRWRYIRYPRGLVCASPAAFSANLKDVRHLDGSHASSLDTVKVDLKGCTAVAGTRRKCNHIVSTRRWSFVAPLVTVATSEKISSRRARGRYRNSTRLTRSPEYPVPWLFLYPVRDNREIRLRELRRWYKCIFNVDKWKYSSCYHVHQLFACFWSYR